MVISYVDKHINTSKKLLVFNTSLPSDSRWPPNASPCFPNNIVESTTRFIIFRLPVIFNFFRCEVQSGSQARATPSPSDRTNTSNSVVEEMSERFSLPDLGSGRGQGRSLASLGNRSILDNSTTRCNHLTTTMLCYVPATSLKLMHSEEIIHKSSFD